jgi:hypothetical protein
LAALSLLGVFADLVIAGFKGHRRSSLIAIATRESRPGGYMLGRTPNPRVTTRWWCMTAHVDDDGYMIRQAHPPAVTYEHVTSLRNWSPTYTCSHGSGLSGSPKPNTDLVRHEPSTRRSEPDRDVVKRNEGMARRARSGTTQFIFFYFFI